jgi:HD superfamily phosphohydrolase
MEVNDGVLGKQQILDPLLVELADSLPVQRLKGVALAGALPLVSPLRNITRFDHSVGVMLLLQKYNASLEEQASGLLHDVGHTAFSHVIDVVFKEYNHNYDDAHWEPIVKNSEIPSIAEKHGLDWKKIGRKENFSLLEQPLPKLCADRLDYCCREMNIGFSKKSFPYTEKLITKNGLFAFSEKETAKNFVIDFIKTSKESWANVRSHASSVILAGAIKTALEEKIVSEKDLYKTDKELLELLKNSSNKMVLQKLSLLNPNLKIKLDENDYDFFSKDKPRWVDPFVSLDNGELIPVSELDEEAEQAIQKRKEEMEKGLYIKILS